MDRNIMSRRSGPELAPKLALLATAAFASVALTGCATASAPRANVSFSSAQVALEKGQVTKAIAHGEAAVLAEPRNPAYRALLGAAYLEAGRFQSAATSFGEALDLGDTDPRTVLSYALAQTAVGEGKQALQTLSEWESALDPADAGLAIALAGNPERGVHVLVNALRSGASDPKTRQNLAYTYALSGNWRAARVMAAEDVPADQLDARLSLWAANSAPENYMVRVSNLLGVTPVNDNGMPAQLALANFPSQEQMVAEADANTPMDAAPVQVAMAPGSAESKLSQTEALTFARDTGTDSDSVESIDPTVARIMAATASAPQRVAASNVESNGSAPVATSGARYVSKPVVQSLPAPSVQSRPTRVASAAPAPRPVAAPQRVATSAPQADTHLVQLGSYVSEIEAKRGWNMLKGKFAQLRDHDVVITKAEVNGKIFYRVAAAGFGRSSAASMCGTVKSAGRGCFAYAKTNPPKGAIDNGVRIAAR